MRRFADSESCASLTKSMVLAGAKLTRYVAMSLCATVIDRGWQVGELLGRRLD
jgi:hypothetical protein